MMMMSGEEGTRITDEKKIILKMLRRHDLLDKNL